MAKSVWKDEFVIKVYELAKSGLSQERMSKALGVSILTFRAWVKKKKYFQIAVETGKKVYGKQDDGSCTFRNYVFKRLSPEMRKYWRRLNKLDKAKAGIDKIEALLQKGGTVVRQHLFVYAWTATNFSISSALRKVNISRCTFNSWRSKDPDFAELIEEINWHKKNFFEDALADLVKGGDSAATIFVNRTYNRDRGYNDKHEIEIKGRVEHVIGISDLDLDIDTQKKILIATRARRKVIESRTSLNPGQVLVESKEKEYNKSEKVKE